MSSISQMWPDLVHCCISFSCYTIIGIIHWFYTHPNSYFILGTCLFAFYMLWLWTRCKPNIILCLLLVFFLTLVAVEVAQICTLVKQLRDDDNRIYLTMIGLGCGAWNIYRGFFLCMIYLHGLDTYNIEASTIPWFRKKWQFYSGKISQAKTCGDDSHVSTNNMNVFNEQTWFVCDILK